MSATQPPGPKGAKAQLPKLRDGLTITFNDYDLDGKPQWVVHDAGRNKFFIIGWVEYEILERWNIGDPDKLLDAVNTETTLHVDMNDLENVLKFLASNYLIQQSSYKIYQSAKEQKLFKDENVLHWLISYYLFFRIPLVHPDKFLNATKRIADFLFSRTTFYVMLVLSIIAVYQINQRWDEFVHTFPSIFTWQGLFFSFIAFMICKCFHELGHAYMCNRYGIPVPALGVAFLVFWPVLYTDTTLSWRLNSKQRLRITLAGIWVETYITIIAALIWCNTSNLTLQSITYVTITVNWLGSLLLNVSPFMRFDGYYALADILKMPNLGPRAFALTRWQIRRWLFAWPEPPPEKLSSRMHYILVIYSIITWLYRLAIYLGIALLVYHFFIKIVGIVLFIIEMFYFIVGPITREIAFWLANKNKFTWNLHTKITVAMSGILLLLFFIPFNRTVHLPATLSYKHAFLYAPEDSIIDSDLPSVGTQVKANQPIVILRSDDLNQLIQQAQLEYSKKLAELRRSSIELSFSHQKNILLSDIHKQRAEYQKLIDQYNKLTLVVNFDGVIKEIASDLHKGASLKKGEWIGDVVAPDVANVEAYASQTDISTIHAKMQGHFYPHNLSNPVIPVIVNAIEVLNTKELTCRYSPEVKIDKTDSISVETPCYNANELGGEIASYMTDNGDYVPIDSVFRIILTPTKSAELSQVERGTVILSTEARSYAARVLYKIKRILIEESGF